MKKRNTKKCKPILSKAEINHFKKEFFYEEIQEGNKIKVPLSIIKKNNYQGEPFLVSMQEKWKVLLFDMLYDGAEKEVWEIPEEVATVIEVTFLTKNGEIVLHPRCMDALCLKEKDMALITSVPRGFFVEKMKETTFEKNAEKY